MTLPLAALLQGAVAGGPTGQTYVDDVFSTYLYTGNGSTQTITNGIDLAGKGGLVWIKSRNLGQDHSIWDTTRGTSSELRTNSTIQAQTVTNGVTAFGASGFTLNGAYGATNDSVGTYVSWTFRKAPKFFDVVTYTGTGSSQTISHSLNQTVGVLVIKRISGTGNWATFARTGGAAGATQYAYFNTSAGLNLTAAAGATGIGAEAAGFITSTGFKPNDLSGSGGAGNADNINENGATYVAYLFAHDTSTDGIIQCGSVTTDGSGNSALQNIGWEPQFVMTKGTTYAGSNDQWLVCDSMRGINKTSNPYLSPNSSSAENFFGTPGPWINPDASGFKIQGLNANTTYIYLAIRRPNKPPTSGTQVYNAIARTGTGGTVTVTGLPSPTDAVFVGRRSTTGTVTILDRLRGAGADLVTRTTSAEGSGNITNSFTQDGYVLNATTNGNGSGESFVDWNFRRAPGVFDVVAWTCASAAADWNHSLGVTPELMIHKKRSATGTWYVWHSALTANQSLYMEQNVAVQADTAATGGSLPNATTFHMGNFGASTMVTYLFATKAGISKVGSYTGNGSSQTINCGFSTGARFILIKRTDATGDWYVWDSTRGIVAGDDPHLSLNTTAAEVTTDDSIDPDNSGFIVNQLAATNINVTSATYIYLAFA